MSDELKPCPWGNDHELKLTGDDVYHELAKGCPLALQVFDLDEWNTRDEPDERPEGLEGYDVAAKAKERVRGQQALELLRDIMTGCIHEADGCTLRGKHYDAAKTILGWIDDK